MILIKNLKMKKIIGIIILTISVLSCKTPYETSYNIADTVSFNNKKNEFEIVEI